MNNKRLINKIKKLILTLIILLGVFLYNNYENIIDKYINNEQIEEIQYKAVSKEIPNLEIYFLDVGQADSTLIKYKDKNILIDAGNNNDGELLVNYFETLGITKFDYLIATHPHEDHIGGMNEIVNNYQINHFLMPNINLTLKTYNNLINSLNNKKIEIEYPKIDEEIEIDDLLIKIISIDNDEDELNNDSIVLKLIYKSNSFLFTGDIEKEKELEILDKDLKSDVLKVAHHGSKYSTSAQFLVKVKPKIAIISVGENNKYNHPDQITIDKLEKINANIYQTKTSGTIKIISDGENIEVEEIKTNTNKE